MAGNHNSGRKPKYLTVERFEAWLNNHWKHMTWKVNGIIAILIVVIMFLIAIFSIGLMSLFGG